MLHVVVGEFGHGEVLTHWNSAGGGGGKGGCEQMGWQVEGEGVVDRQGYKPVGGVVRGAGWTWLAKFVVWDMGVQLVC